ncbi:hypothetical protein BDV98DRAFT_601446 [Pterulicium gracile]|uniref:DUF6534 domain-containing protein n=1 Tax=Pterulicium gracile TaxID=1884261 RepID=A0A5C3QUC2_9AGAR|nr:hypothetical protein BDV98DRAFT_601446 [Pterula gracilis]
MDPEASVQPSSLDNTFGAYLLGIYGSTATSTASVMDSAFTAVIAHGIYAHRIYAISGGLCWPSITVIALASTRFGCWCALCVVTFKIQYFARLGESLKCARPAVAFSVATDVFIAICLTYYLRKGRSGRKSTDSVLNKLMIVTINNGLLACIVDILVLDSSSTIPISSYTLASTCSRETCMPIRCCLHGTLAIRSGKARRGSTAFSHQHDAQAIRFFKFAHTFHFGNAPLEAGVPPNPGSGGAKGPTRV